uniref:Uncharacterized protein n=1 Tax=Panagrolaimus davidi TaxID=227884 RepID=A0A914PP82_9BILA
MRNIIVILFALISISKIASSLENDCPAILQSSGGTTEFGIRVGHAIHSLSVRNLKQFKPDVTEKNQVPTVNLNLTSDIPILSYAPDRTTPDSHMFLLDGSIILDEILSHMDDKSYNLKNYNPLEQIVHTFHMEEIWAAALIDYRNFEINPPSDDVCQCALDIENNGILMKLRQTALIIREPNLMLGYGQYRAKQQCLKNPSSPGCPFFKSIGNSLPPLDSAKAWKRWKMDSGAMNGKDTALFLYCALNTNINIEKYYQNFEWNKKYHY